MLPKEHPLHKIIRNHRTSKVKRHRGPLHHLVRWFKLDALKTSIANSREESIKKAVNAKEELQIYSDGSALEGKVGAAAILIYKGRHTQTLHYHLRSDEEHTVHEAEAVGI